MSLPSVSFVLTRELTLAEPFFFCSPHLEPRHCPFMSKAPTTPTGRAATTSQEHTHDRFAPHLPLSCVPVFHAIKFPSPPFHTQP